MDGETLIPVRFIKEVTSTAFLSEAKALSGLLSETRIRIFPCVVYIQYFLF